MKEFYKQDKYSSIKRIYKLFMKETSLDERKKLFYLAKLLMKSK